MQKGLKFANRLRLDLAIEIQQLASGVRNVTQATSSGPVDVTDQALAVSQERFTILEDLIAVLVTGSGAGRRPAG